jgi:glutathione S-transferase
MASSKQQWPAPQTAMKLYYFPQTSALAVQIVAEEAGIALQPERIDPGTKKTADGGDYLAITAKGYVPALVLDSGEVLTEVAAIIQYLADLKPEARLAPANGTFARVRLQETLNYLSAEIQRAYRPLFDPATPPQVREAAAELLRRRFALLDRQLADHDYLMGDEFTIADAYLFSVTRWAQLVNLDLADFANLQARQQALASRPAVQAAMRAHGLM